MQGNVPQILFAFLLLGILAPVLYIHITRSQKLLKRWADENRYEFLYVEHRMFRKGPFAFVEMRRDELSKEAFDRATGNMPAQIKQKLNQRD